ncbi:MAG: ABC transporter substrate-binding protein [Melioribacteraceae bacterium]|nr:MAG: ABC transporter substrate-binding protein [Melioribacteraceae bacterium]
MKLLLKLAWRNIWRNKRRSLLTLAAVAFATFAAIGMRGIQLGTYDVNIKNAASMFAGYLQVQKNGYQENPRLRKAVKYDEKLIAAIKAEEHITGFTPRIYADGLVSGEKSKTSQGTAVFAVDPESEKKVTTLVERVNEGRFISSSDSYEIVVGHKLLKNLNAEIGDTLVLLSQGFDGSMGNFKFEVTGTIKTGSSDLDGMGVIIGLDTARELLYMYGKVHAVVLMLDNMELIDDVKTSLSQAITDTSAVVLNWGEVMPDFKQSIEFDNISGIMMLAILIVIVAFGILNTVLMSVTERFNEFGVTLSIGMPQIKLVYLVIIETIFITIIGIIIGDIGGWVLNNYIVDNPIHLGAEFADMYAEYGFLPIIESSLDYMIFVNVSISVVIISLISVVYPAMKVYKLEALKGIRYT